MDVTTAVALINSIIYKPGWKFEATDHTNRFEGSITLCVSYPARNTNRDQADDEFPEEIVSRATFPLVVADCPDQIALLRRVFTETIIEVEIHEAREFFRVHPSNWAPFHPHHVDGMNRWGKPELDLRFGIA